MTQIIKKINKNAIIYTPLVSDLYSSDVKAEVFDLDGIDKIIEGELEATKERDEIIQFIQNSQRGIMKGYFQS